MNSRKELVKCLRFLPHFLLRKQLSPSHKYNALDRIHPYPQQFFLSTSHKHFLLKVMSSFSILVDTGAAATFQWPIPEENWVSLPQELWTSCSSSVEQGSVSPSHTCVHCWLAWPRAGLSIWASTAVGISLVHHPCQAQKAPVGSSLPSPLAISTWMFCVSMCHCETF